MKEKKECLLPVVSEGTMSSLLLEVQRNFEEIYNDWTEKIGEENPVLCRAVLALVKNAINYTDMSTEVQILSTGLAVYFLLHRQAEADKMKSELR